MTRTKSSTGKKTKSSKRGSVPKSAIEKEAFEHSTALLYGTILAIDPSSGSANSQPGYALYSRGKLIDSGLVRIRSGDHISNRLYRLSHSLLEEFEQPDLLVTENIPPFMGDGPGASFATRNVISLHQSIGVIMSVWPVPVVAVSPRSWRSLIPDNYVKSDENDAIMIGWTAIETARRVQGIDEEPFTESILVKLTTGKWE
jgi:hypothetical protein